MTAGELIAALKHLPPETKVLIGNGDGNVGQALVVAHQAGTWASNGQRLTAKPEILAELGLTLGETCVVLDLYR